MHSWEMLGSPKNIAFKEKILQHKDSGLFFDREVRALMHSCEKLGSLKYIASQEDIVSKEEILQSNGGGLLLDGKVSTFTCSCEKPDSQKDIASKIGYGTSAFMFEAWFSKGH
eukprot:5216937-Ditylum_brightwellii.AAC.1